MLDYKIQSTVGVLGGRAGAPQCRKAQWGLGAPLIPAGSRDPQNHPAPLLGSAQAGRAALGTPLPPLMVQRECRQLQ